MVSVQETPTIKGVVINLVPFTDQHLHTKEYLQWINTPEVIKYARLDYVKEQTPADAYEYVTILRESKNDYFFAIETTEKKFIGTFKIGHINWKMKRGDLGIMIGDKSYWGKGIATEVFKIAIDFCFDTLNFIRITCGCTELNSGMRRVAIKTGFKQEGFFRDQDLIDGRYYGHYYFGLLKKEYLKKEYKI